jgi:hypothetical protein
MSYLPSPYTGFYTRIDNTMISGSQLLSYLSKDDVRMLEFNASIASPPLIITTGATSSTVNITAQQLIQATIGTMGVNCSTGPGIIYLGTDSQSQASTYVNLFNLRSTNDVRTLKFYASTANASGNTNLAVSSTASATNVIIRQDGNTSSQGYSMALFFSTASSASGTQLTGSIGTQRIVEVSATDVSSGSENVVFNILTNSL